MGSGAGPRRRGNLGHPGGVERGKEVRAISTEPDEVLIERSCGGDQQAFGLLVERHAPALFAWIRRFVRTPSDVDDAAQETFLAAWRHLPSWVPSRGSWRGWLFGIARRRALNLERRRRPMPSSDTAAVPDAEAARTSSEPVEFVRLDRALADLPDALRVAFVLTAMHGLSLADVAALENVPVGTVKSRCSRARARLREALPLTPEATA